MTLKRRSSETFADENREIFRKKVKFRKFSTTSEILSKIGGKSETGGKYIMALGGMDAPVYRPIYGTQNLKKSTSFGRT